MITFEAVDLEAWECSLADLPFENLAVYHEALRLHGQGYSLIPVSKRTKRPVVKWKCFQSRRPTPSDLYQWFAVAGFRIGIVTGQLSGIVVVDCDDLDSVDALLDWSVDHDWPESLVTQRTTRGLHLFYRHPGIDTRNRIGCLGEKIDVRGDGGYVLLHEAEANVQRDLMPVFVPLP